MKSFTYKLFPALICFVFLFPIIKESISTLSVILLSINTILYRIATKEKFSVNYKNFLLTIPFFFILVYNLFSNNLVKNAVHIQHSLFFFVIPALFSFVPIEFFSLKKLNLYFSTLKIICLFIAITYLLAFFINNPLWKFDIEFQNESTFRNYIYNDFTWFKIHPTYYTTILIFCVVHSLDSVLKEKKYIQLIYVFSFLGITFLLLTKLTIIVMIFFVLYMLLYKNSFPILYKAISTVLLFLSLFFLIQFTPGIKKRYEELYKSFNVKPQGLAFDSTNVRKAIFDCSMKLVEKSGVWGIGFENVQTELNKCYESNYDSEFYKNHNYMTHNYYFYFLISSGFLGFFFLMIYLANIVKISLKSNFFLFNSLVITILIICLTEDFLFRHYGILYFNIMIMAFIKHIEYKKLDNIDYLKE